MKKAPDGEARRFTVMPGNKRLGFAAYAAFITSEVTLFFRHWRKVWQGTSDFGV